MIFPTFSIIHNICRSESLIKWSSSSSAIPQVAQSQLKAQAKLQKGVKTAVSMIANNRYGKVGIYAQHESRILNILLDSDEESDGFTAIE